MSIHISEVLDYLDTHPICCHKGTVTSLMEMLYDVYVMHNTIDSEEIQNKLQEVLILLPQNQHEPFLTSLCDICAGYELLAFSHGIVVGMHLMSEINTLP